MNIAAQVVKVGIADLKIVSAPEVLRTSGLGSCVGVVIYDVSTKVAGMAHIMLPDSGMNRSPQQNRWKFADTAIEDLYSLMMEKGVRKYALKAKIAGGSQMFSFPGQSDKLRIGARNIEAVLHSLKEYRIPVIGQDTGGNSGRTIEFYPDTGILKIRTVNKGEIEI